MHDTFLWHFRCVRLSGRWCLHSSAQLCMAFAKGHIGCANCRHISEEVRRARIEGCFTRPHCRCIRGTFCLSDALIRIGWPYFSIKQCKHPPMVWSSPISIDSMLSTSRSSLLLIFGFLIGLVVSSALEGTNAQRLARGLSPNPPKFIRDTSNDRTTRPSKFSISPRYLHQMINRLSLQPQNGVLLLLFLLLRMPGRQFFSNRIWSLTRA